MFFRSIVSFAVCNIYNVMEFNLSFLRIRDYILGTLSRRFLTMPVSSAIFSNSVTVFSLRLRSLIYFMLIFITRDWNVASLVSVHVPHILPTPFVEEVVFPPKVYFCILSNIMWLHLFNLICRP